MASSERVKDADGRLMPHAVARPISDATLEAAEDIQTTDENRLMNLMHNNYRASTAALAKKMGFEKHQVYRIIRRLEGEKRVEKVSNRYLLTKKGEKEIGDGNT